MTGSVRRLYGMFQQKGRHRISQQFVLRHRPLLPVSAGQDDQSFAVVEEVILSPEAQLLDAAGDLVSAPFTTSSVLQIRVTRW